MVESLIFCKMKNKQIETLKIYFEISNAAFEFQRSITSALGYVPHPTEMEILHNMALAELYKPEPNLGFIDYLLVKMEALAKQKPL